MGSLRTNRKQDTLPTRAFAAFGSFSIRNSPTDIPSGLHPDLRADDMPVRKDLAELPFNVNAADTAMRVRVRLDPGGTPQDLPQRRDQERLKDMVGPGRRFPFGLPRTDNATATRVNAKIKLAKPDRRSVGETELHYLWIQLFHSALNEKGRAGFVMANGTREAHSCSMKNAEDVRKYAANKTSPEKRSSRKARKPTRRNSWKLAPRLREGMNAMLSELCARNPNP